MTETTKSAGADCPKCGETWPAEYAFITGEARWSCGCGASGPLTGQLSIRSKSAPAPAPEPQRPVVKEHWRNVSKAV